MEYIPIRFADDYLKYRDVSNQKHNVLVAVMDTGIDPGAYGLTKCPDGSAKVIDVIDCSGSDDVVVTLLKDSDEKIKIGDLTDTPIYYGERDFKSFISVRSYKSFEKKQQNVIDTLIFKIYVYKKNNEYMLMLDYDGNINNNIIINEYHINQKYGSIPLDDGLMYNFGFHVYPSKSSDKLIASLVFDTGSHASHVAGIIGGYFEDHPEYNGINPHAKILSLKIGDSRVDGMETTISFIRALKEIVKYNCHLVNYSYGESVGKLDGKLIDILNEYILKYNIMFCTSAGNSGPSITTVGAPAVSTTNVLSIGAYTDYKILSNIYYLTSNDYTKGVYQWSSRGPSLNNSMGVDVIAPGCAITSHPMWYKSDTRLCNGTSMASPNACGFISLIFSQFNNSSQYPQAYWIKKYAESTCKYIKDHPIPDPKSDPKSDSKSKEIKETTRRVETFSQGCGLLGYYFENPLEYFSNLRDYYYNITVDQNMNKGILITQKKYSNSDDDPIVKKSFTVKIDPMLYNGKVPTSFKKNLKLEGSDSINKFLKYPKEIMVTNADISFRVDVLLNTKTSIIVSDTSDTSGTNSNNNYFTNDNHISGYLELYEEDNLVGYVPINVFFYQDLHMNNSYNQKNVSIYPNIVHRSYVMCHGNVLDIKLNTNILDKLYIDVAQHPQNTKIEDRSISKIYTREKDQIENLIFNVQPNVLTEISICTAWSSPVSQMLDFTIRVTNRDVSIRSNIHEINQDVHLTVNEYDDKLNNEIKEMKTNLSINHVFTKYFPSEVEIIQPDDRYVFNTDYYKNQGAENNINLKLMRMTYKINSHKNTMYYVNTCNQVYESDTFMSACIIGYLNNKQVFFANYKPKFCDVPLDKIVIEVMDSDMDKLEYHSRTILTALRKLSKSISIEKQLKQGLNVISLPTNEIFKLDDSMYDGDYLKGEILDKSICWIYKSKPKIKNLIKIDQSRDQSHEGEASKNNNEMKLINEFIKDFSLFKKFICKQANAIDLVDSVDETERKNNSDRDDLVQSLESFKKRSYDEIMDISDSDRAKIDYLSLLVEENKTTGDVLIKKLYDRFKSDKLLKTPPYCTMEYVTTKKVKRFKSIDVIEKNMSYWKNCTVDDIMKLKLDALNDIAPTDLPDLTSDEKIIVDKNKSYLICSDFIDCDGEIMTRNEHNHLKRKINYDMNHRQ